MAIVWKGHQAHTYQERDGENLSRSGITPKQRKAKDSCNQKPNRGRLVEEAEQGESGDTGQTGEDIDTVCRDAPGRFFQIPANKLPKGDEGGGNQSEKRHDTDERKTHAAPTGGLGRNPPDMDFHGGSQQLRQIVNAALQSRNRRLEDNRQQQKR